MRLNGLHIGELDTLYTIEEPTFTPDSVSGEQVKTWQEFGTVWGKPVEMSGEKFEGDQQVALISEKIVVRFLDGINETMRLLDPDGEYHYIKGIDKNDRRVSLVLKTEKRNNG